MNSRDILAANFKKLRAATPSLSRLPDITKAGGGSNGTLGRIASMKSGATIDTVEQLAAVYGLEAWQMLVPTFEAKQGSGQRPAVTGLPGWPFEEVEFERWNRLNSTQKGMIQQAMLDAIEKIEARAALKTGAGS